MSTGGSTSVSRAFTSSMQWLTLFPAAGFIAATDATCRDACAAAIGDRGMVHVAGVGVRHLCVRIPAGAAGAAVGAPDAFRTAVPR